MAYPDDTSSGLASLFPNVPSFFWGNSPNVNQQLRQRIALQMMASKRPYPKTFGEGLSAIGGALGDIGMARALEQGDLAQQSQAASLAPPSEPTAITAPSPDQPKVVRPPQQTSSSEVEPGVSDGGYNFMDAQAGMKAKMPGYLQDAITRNVADPDMQAYLGSLSAREAPRGAGDVSPTGASGPYQFTRGTGKQYGLMDAGGDQRADLDASTLAAQKLTQDNAAVFQRINGRPPTMAELAVMHQQGGTTGAKMVAGTGNAPASNLAVNNINPASGPAAAVAGIKNYYGLPDRPIDARDRVASAMAQMPPPAAPDQRLAALTPRTTTTDIQTAPAVPPQIRTVPPPTRVAQAGPAEPPARFDYVPAAPQAPQPPPPAPMTPTERWAQQQLLAYPNNDYVKQRMAPVLAQEQAQRALIDKQNNEKYQSDLGLHRTLIEKREQALADRAKNLVEGQQKQEGLTKAQQENALRAQFGNMPPEDVFKMLSASRGQAQSAAQALTATKNAREALDKGIITGSGANQRLDVAKFFTALGLVDKHDRIANTETFRAAMQPVVASILHATSGTSQLSDNELAFAKAAAAGDIRLDAQSIRQLMTIIDKQSNDIVSQHQTKMDALFGASNPQAKAVYGVEVPKTLEPPKLTSATPVRVSSPEEASRYRSGTKIILPDGRQGTVP